MNCFQVKFSVLNETPSEIAGIAEVESQQNGSDKFVGEFSQEVEQHQLGYEAITRLQKRGEKKAKQRQGGRGSGLILVDLG